jgi:uncharacterized protein Yka (UPF0111/DUF47 family)
MKVTVLKALGEAELSQPALVNAALAANDRVKYFLSLLQTAIAHADQPQQVAEPLQAERIAAGIDDPALDRIVAGTQQQGARYRIPGAADLLSRIAADMRIMAAPVLAANDASFGRRLDALLGALPHPEEDRLDGPSVAAMTRAGTAGSDSLHQLVMDLHKALNALQTALAEDHLDGAAVYGLAQEDRPRVAAFMAGLNRTAPLKFGHPGLGTAATRADGRLVIQNDIGTTDAHVIVIHVTADAVDITYSDVHPERLRFLQEMLAGFDVAWSGQQQRHVAALAAGDPFTLVTGRFAARDEAGLRLFLRHLGSRLVFLIDWNRARKQLRSFLHEDQRQALLRWAAENEVGHRGFLELGGAALINDAIEVSAGSAMHFGDRLCDALGNEAAMAFLQFTFRAASDGLRAHQSRGLIQDRVRADLAAHFSNEAHRLLLLAADHAGLIFEIAALVREQIVRLSCPDSAAEPLAPRARRFEHDADALVIRVREMAQRRPDHAPMLHLMEASDDAADHLEDAAFLLDLLARGNPSGPPLEALQTLGELLLEASQEWVKTLAHGKHLDGTPLAPNAMQDDVDDFLTAIDRVVALEHEVDDAERALTYVAVQEAADFRQLHLFAAIGSGLEEATDALKRASLSAREQILRRVLHS